MLKERIVKSVFIISFFIFMSAFVSAAGNSSVDKAYDCLENLIENKTTSTISLQESTFSMLAIGGKKVLKDKIAEEKSSSDDCWPKEKCTLKETAQVGLAYERINKDTDEIVDWLLTKNSTCTELVWFLEIDSTTHEPSECNIRYDGNERTIKILDDMTLSGNPGNCFTISPNRYFLQFKESCFSKDIEISCDKDFVTALLYSKKTGETLYVLPETHSAAALGTTVEQVNVQCFKKDGKCDYEGSLWATLTLHKLGEDVGAFAPYLVALAEDNSEFFPESFLYSLTGSEDQYSKMIEKQKQTKMWEMIGTPYNEYYDTSLAMQALSESEKEGTKSYLLSIQPKSGCWNNNNIRDTAFLLYSGWTKSVSGGDVDVAGSPLCSVISTQSCEISNECTDAEGLILSQFDCPGFNVCCSVDVPEKTCAEQEGIICGENQECDGTIAPSSEEGNCCLGTCKEIEPEVEDTCTPGGFACSSYCLDGEETVDDLTCSDGGVCCKPESKSYTWMIILLIVMIVALALAIIYRDKLRFYWYKYRGEASSKPVIKPGVPPSDQPPVKTAPANPNRAPPRIQPQPTQPRTRAPPVQKSKEFEETLRKLREMSK